MQVGVETGGGFVFKILHQFMRFLPITFAIVPKGAEVHVERVRRRGGTKTGLKSIEIHGVKLRKIAMTGIPARAGDRGVIGAAGKNSLYLIHEKTHIFLMPTIKQTIAFIALLLTGTGAFAQMQKAPAYPLIVHDPYFSIWSFSDTLNKSVTRHWTGANQSLEAFIKVDDKLYRVMGKPRENETGVAVQKSVEVKATQTTYVFHCGPVNTTLRFTNPLLLRDLALLSRPVSYISCSVRSNDGGQHAVQVYFAVSSDLSVNTPAEEVICSGYRSGGLDILKAGTTEQPVLQKKEITCA